MSTWQTAQMAWAKNQTYTIYRTANGLSVLHRRPTADDKPDKAPSLRVVAACHDDRPTGSRQRGTTGLTKPRSSISTLLTG